MNSSNSSSGDSVVGLKSSDFQSSFARALAQQSCAFNNHLNNEVVTLKQQQQQCASTEDAADDTTCWQLKEECQRLLEENRRLRASAMLGPLNNDHEQRAEVALLQSRVNTLSWQLSQSESSRGMLRSVSAQVVSFLERVSSSMLVLEKKNASSRSGCRVPRSRSTHTVAEFPVRETAREFVPRSSLVQRSGSDVQGTDASSWECTWRKNKERSSSLSEDEAANPARLGQQARRLARTVRSLLATQELEMSTSTPGSTSLPVSPTSIGTSLAPATTALATPATFSQLLRTSRRRLSYNDNQEQRRASSYIPRGESLEDRRTSFLQELTDSPRSPVLSRRTSRSVSYHEETLTSTTLALSSAKSSTPLSDNLSIYLTPSMSISSSESSSSSSTSPTRKQDPHGPMSSSADESGFSSLGSFQEIGLPVTYPQNGLPLPNHVRCRSTPISTKTKSSYYSRTQDGNSELSTLEKLKVLWV